MVSVTHATSTLSRGRRLTEAGMKLPPTFRSEHLGSPRRQVSSSLEAKVPTNDRVLTEKFV